MPPKKKKGGDDDEEFMKAARFGRVKLVVILGGGEGAWDAVKDNNNST